MDHRTLFIDDRALFRIMMYKQSYIAVFYGLPGFFGNQDLRHV